MIVKVKKINDTATIPTRGTEYAAGYDLYASDAFYIPGAETRMIGTGICMEIPDGYAGFIYARSGLASKFGLRPANCVGVVDSDYRGEIKVALHNDSQIMRYIDMGERIAQIVIAPYMSVEFVETNELDKTERNDGGFGSTGKK